MKSVLSAELERGRIRHGQFGSDFTYGANGAFLISFRGVELKIIASDGTGWESSDDLPGEPWEHVSVSCRNRTPNWREMSYVKDLFWADDELVLQFHIPKADHINHHPFCLHMWRPTQTEIPLPPPITVAPPEGARK